MFLLAKTTLKILLLLNIRLFSSHVGFITYAMYRHRETVKSNTFTVMKQKTITLYPQTVRATEIPSLTVVSPAKDYHQAPTHR